MKTLLLSSSIAAIMGQTHDASDIKTAAVGINAIAKAAKAFAGVTLDSKRPTFAAIASIARVTESDACNLAGMSGKDSNLRNALRVLRREIVGRIVVHTVAHDAADDAADVVTIDKMVSNLDTIAKHLSSIVRA
jgi:hypothetical protein